MILLIFDINGVLCKSYGKGKASLRPGLRKFFKTIERWVDEGWIQIAFWTSKMEHNGRMLLNKILYEAEIDENIAQFVWFNTDCTPCPTLDDPYAVIKDLEKVWERFPRFNAKNTYLIDDTTSKAGKYAKDNLLWIPAYEGTRMSSDNELEVLADRLSRL